MQRMEKKYFLRREDEKKEELLNFAKIRTLLARENRNGQEDRQVAKSRRRRGVVVSVVFVERAGRQECIVLLTEMLVVLVLVLVLLWSSVRGVGRASTMLLVLLEQWTRLSPGRMSSTIKARKATMQVQVQMQGKRREGKVGKKMMPTDADRSNKWRCADQDRT
ncbi:hypothetical protein GGR50DRAFT_492996 [Xylaria sp. CBS 124048]|nr:hypothetical protein GGR50DRAFT_492996 [Xylaria sp. CBS 124048]